MSAARTVIHSNRPIADRGAKRTDRETVEQATRIVDAVLGARDRLPIGHPVGCLCDTCQRRQLDAPPPAERTPTSAAAALDELRGVLRDRRLYFIKRDRSRTGTNQTIGVVYVTTGSRELRSVAWLVACALHRRYVADKDGITMPGGEAARMAGDLSAALYDGDRTALIVALI